MSRHRHSSRQKPPPAKNGFWRAVFWLCFGFTAGLGVAAWFAATINQMPLPFAETPTRGGVDGSDNLQKSRREALEFHETLQQQQQPAEFDAEEKSTTPRDFVYYLQIAAYSDRALAEEARGQIALLGEQASLRPNRDSSGNEIFRVWLGPYANRSVAESARANLALQGYDEIQLLKLAEKQ